MSGQPQLDFDWSSLARLNPVEWERAASIQSRFLAFHRANPQVYDALVKMVRVLKGRGRKRVGIGMLFEVLRWNHAMQTLRGDAEDYKLNNNFRSRYARMIAESEPDLADVFETRELKSE